MSSRAPASTQKGLESSPLWLCLQALLSAVAAAAGTSTSPLSIAGGLPKQVGGGSIGTTTLLHFAYRLSAKQQFVLAPFSEPLDSPSLQQASACLPLLGVSGWVVDG